MTSVFISYARKDGRELADLIAKDARFSAAWLDTREIAGGMDWVRTIEKGIDECDVFLAVLTAAYNASDVCGMEYMRGYEKKKRQIPLHAHPQADVPLLLNRLQWVDFTDAAARQASLDKLFEAIAHPVAPDQASPEKLAWEKTYARAARKSHRFLRQYKGTFTDDLYIHRNEAERALAAFLGGQNPALVLVGESGVGKTNVLCRWTLDLLAQGHAVLAYDCSQLPSSDVAAEIAEDLDILEKRVEGLEDIDAQASTMGRKLVIVFDSIGDYAGDGPEALLKKINAFAGRVAEHTRVVVSCNAAIWNRMQSSRGIRLDDVTILQLGNFSEAELALAYPLYREVFKLRSALDDLAEVVRDRLRQPVLLRMTAEAFRNSPQALPVTNLAARVYEQFFKDRVRTDRQRWLVNALAAEMIHLKTSALAVGEYAPGTPLGDELLREGADSTYLQLLDCGVLLESLERDDRKVIKFAHTRLAAYALATHLRKPPAAERGLAVHLVAQEADFPLAWETAKTLLLISEDRGPLTAALATSNDGAERELAAEALVELYAEDAAAGNALLQSLLEQESEAGRRTALKAAYGIGPDMRDFFYRAASGAPTMQEAVRNTLYLIWRRPTTEAFYVIWKQAPEFTYELLDDLLDELSPVLHPFKAKTIFSFVVDLTITIYINHCDDQRVIAKTAELLRKLWLERIHLDRIDSWFGNAVPNLLRVVFGRQILDWMLFTEDMPSDAFFALPKEDRDRLGRIGDAFDPAADIIAAHDDLVTMLRSGIPIFSGSAAMAVVVHASSEFAKTKPLVDALWNEVGGVGRLWLLVGFSVLMKGTPDEWVDMLTELTDSYVRNERDTFLGDASRVAGNLDIVFLPLGLAYGKRRDPSMKLFETLLQEGIANGDKAWLARCVAALGVVGFYYPQAMFEVIRPLMKMLDGGPIERALVASLATVRTLHFDAVDRFLNSVKASEGLRQDIDVAADVGLVRRYIRVLGYYNNAVHFTLKYPRMRMSLSSGALKSLATAANANQFVADYTETALRMLRESKYDVLEWTKPE